MRIGSGQLAGLKRTTLLLAACAVLVATTSGLLLTLHLLSVDHSADHDSHDCAICQQLLIVSKNAAIVASVELTHDTPVFRTDLPAMAEPVGIHQLQASLPRGPPLPTHFQ
ncbi:MAG TPA: hypothetical protein PKH24_08160 [Sedimentisphaerales bacterium]|jgi:hypothetical protein|nr:hypothetical protein [Sedimentisphaerales bacterium]HNU28953.1 hypothetical protein [Sedimentisphaerales bacterium]